MNICIFIFLELLCFLSINADTKQCSEKLLDNKNKVPDSAFTESSYKEEFKGKWARESAPAEMAWCPNHTVTRFKKDYLIIDLGEIYFLRMIMTKGLSRHGFYTAKSYFIEYKREIASDWLSYRSRGQEKKIKGNPDHLTEGFESLEPPIITRWIKVFPYGEKPEQICLIVQIYGCKYTSNIMEYRMIDGDKRKNFHDFNYDGQKSGTYLSGGLGKLVQYHETFVEDPFDVKNTHLIGWYHPDMQTSHVQMIFRFSDFRNFTRLKIHASNFYTKKVKIFSSINIQFSNDGITYEETRVLVHTLSDDNLSPQFKFVMFDLKHNVGLFVKLSLTFRSEWIIIKTVEFTSDGAVEYPMKPIITKAFTGITKKPATTYGDNDFFSIPLAYTLVIVISILIIMLLIGIPCVTIFVRRQKYRNKKCKEALRRHFQEEHARFLTLSTQQFKDSTNNATLFTVSNFNPSLPNINGRMMQESSIYTSLAGSDTESNCPSDKQQQQQCMAPNFSFINTCPIINPLTSNRGSISNDYSATSFTSLGSNGASYVPYYISNAQMARSQLNLRSHYDMVNPAATIQNDSYSTDEHNQRAIPMYGPARVSIQGPLRNSKLHSIIPFSDPETMLSLSSLMHDLTYANVPLENLKYLKTICRGHYGSIHIGQWSKVQDTMMNSNKKFQTNEYNTLRQSLTTGMETENIFYQFPEKQVSSIKVLSKDASPKMKNEFCKEIKRLLSINHKSFPSIWKIEETPLGDCVVVNEHTSLNDLYSYLQNFHLKDIKDQTDHHYETGTKPISQSNLIYIASQIGSGMKHLEFLKLVHRDLSCRNVFVMNEELVIKISDLAIANEKFSSDYVIFPDPTINQIHKSTSSLIQLQSNLIHSCQSPTNELNLAIVLPIRWMAWQALLQGNFSNKSDVYSFGVTLWELFTLCRKQPYHELTNEQVIINSNLQALGDDRARSLQLPNKFSKEFSDFLTHCMHFNESTRPSFIEIDMFLQHKNVGFKLH